MLSEILIVITMTLTAYAPACGGINGSPNRKFVTSENSLRIVACGFKYPKGTRFRILGMEQHGISNVICLDRGGSVGRNNIDLLVYSGSCRNDYRFARFVGRRKVQVVVE